MAPDELLKCLTIGVTHRQALRVYLARSSHTARASILSGLINHLFECTYVVLWFLIHKKLTT